eukprot:COSAG02_NODE_261_length_26663_cov_210.330899_8_plen_192_part_00
MQDTYVNSINRHIRAHILFWLQVNKASFATPRHSVQCASSSAATDLHCKSRWGEKGFRKEDQIDNAEVLLTELRRLNDEDDAHGARGLNAVHTPPRTANLDDLTRSYGPTPTKGEMIFEVMILACVIDGAATHREIALLKQARRIVEPSDTWHRLEEDDVELHNAMLDHRVEERVHTWAKTIGDGISIFVS